MPGFAALGAVVVLSWALLFAGQASADRTWLPPEGQLQLSPIVVYETFDSFYRGSDLAAYPPGRYEQITALVAVEYGLRDRISLDFTLGYVRAFGDPIVNDGLYDTTLGISFGLLDEFAYDSPWVPTLSFRFGGIIAGTYEANGLLFPGIPGDKASGVEGEFSAGKLLPYDLGVTMALGVRAREKGVPIDWHLRVGSFWTALDVITLSFAYDQWMSTSGIDIGGPGWNPNRFRELKEHSGNIEAALSVGELWWGLSASFFYAHTVWGRNTGQKDIAGGVISVPFDLFGG